MSLWRQFTHGVRSVVQRRRADDEVADEVRSYLDEATAANRARGMPAERAARAARVELGSALAVREAVRTSGWEETIASALADARYALRRLRNDPAFAIAAIATLALGIGASTAVFSAVSPILLEPLPFAGADRLVAIADHAGDGGTMDPTFGSYIELRTRSHAFAALASADWWAPSLTGPGDPERLHGQRVTAGYFGLFGVPPLFGRDFSTADDRPGAPSVVILSYALVQRRFGGDRSIVGRSIQLNGDDYVVLGVMPPGFANVTAPAVDIWSPMRATGGADFNTREWGHHYQVVGRLAPEVTPERATLDTKRIGGDPVPDFPRPMWASLKDGLVVLPLQDEITGNVRPALLAIVGAVLLLLTIAAVNVANLLLGRGAQRRAELALRVALGAGRDRLLRQLLTESVVLALLGGLLGLGVAAFGVRALVAASPPGLPRVDAIRLDGRVFIFALGLTTLIGFLVGLVPAVAASRTEVNAGLQLGSRRTAGARGAVRSVLVMAEVGLALVLLVSAGLLYRSVTRLLSVAPGFDPSQVITMQVVEAGHAFDSDSVRLRFYTEALDAVRQLPGVTAAAFSSQIPLTGDVDGYGAEWASMPEAKPGEMGSALRYAVTPEYFKAMRIPLRRGRLLDATDRPGAPAAVLINESYAKRLFGDRDAIGQRVRFGPDMGGSRPWAEVVGVVGDVKQQSLALDAPDAFYVSNGQWSWVDNAATLVVRSGGDAAALTPVLKRTIWSVNPNPPIQRISTMDAFIRASAGQRAFALVAIEAFALAALVLAAVGLYGVIAGGVTERMREIGIRAALGASPHELVRSVVGRALVLTAAGACIGLAGALAASRLLESMLFTVSRLDPVTYAAVIATLVGVAALAAWAPARRAAGVDPTIALRAE